MAHPTLSLVPDVTMRGRSCISHGRLGVCVCVRFFSKDLGLEHTRTHHPRGKHMLLARVTAYSDTLLSRRRLVAGRKGLAAQLCTPYNISTM